MTPFNLSLPSAGGNSTTPTVPRNYFLLLPPLSFLSLQLPFSEQDFWALVVLVLIGKKLMLPESDLARPRTNDEKVTLGCRKNAQTKAPVDQALKCPRCDSPNTKFCYYNNYSLSQPRHFCKTCRRYWTKGGALRNVPVGGGCRKNKKVKSSLRLPGGVGSKDDSGSSNSEIGRLGFFNNGFSSAMDFQLGGSGNSPFSTVHNAPAMGLFDQFGIFSLDHSRSSNSFTSIQSPLASTGFNALNNVNTSLASSIESLSSINQDLHWKLQQQRLAMQFAGDNTAHKDSGISSPIALENHNHKLHPNSFQNMEISKPEVCNSSDINARKEIIAGAGGDSATTDEWFFGNSYAATSMTTATMPNTMTGAAAPSCNSGDNAAGCDGAQEWHDLHQYSHLP